MRICLKPLRRGSEVVSTLYMESEEAQDLFQSFRQHSTSAAILADVPYMFVLEGQFSDIPSGVDIYVDDEKIYLDSPGYREDGSISLNCRSAAKPVFADCYGFIQLKIELRYQDDDIETLYSDYFQVLLPDNAMNQSMQKMAEFVYQNHAKYLYNPHESSEYETFGSIESIDGQIGIIGEVVQVYMANLPFFKANPHTRAANRYSVQDVEKLRLVTPKIMRYICLHPDQLSPAEQGVGIRDGDQYYLPKKTLVLDTERVRNTYENRVVISFIRAVLEETGSLNRRIGIELETAKKYEAIEGYISSARVILQGVEEKLKMASDELTELEERLRELYWQYSEFLEADTIGLDHVPDATGVFRTSLPYRQIFECIVRWFSKGSYNFYNESLMLPFMLNHHLYEYYGLIKLIKTLENEDFVLHPEKCLNFRYPIRSKVYTQTGHFNTLYFERNDESVVLYYQPVIWGQQYREEAGNGIRLRRSTSYAIKNSTSHPNAYWTPDYLMKYQSEGKERYLVLDAKYTERLNFLGDHMSDLAYQYSFAVQPMVNAELVGDCFLYGKSYSLECTMETAHDIYRNGRERIFCFMSLSEGNSDEATQMQELSKLITVLKGE